MINIKPTIDAIERLLAEGTNQSITYAALECRLAIEALCYERLSIVHDYISHDDLKRWQPKDVVNVLIKEVEPKISATFTVHISREPIPEGKRDMTQTDYEAHEYVPIGTQVGFDPEKMGKLWQALAGLALHVPVPNSSSEEIIIYNETGKLRRKVLEALEEIRRVSSRTLLSGGLGDEVTFECVCGSKNKRRAKLLTNDQIISCIMMDCKESFTVKIENSEIYFSRRTIPVNCSTCAKCNDIPIKWFETLKNEQARDYYQDLRFYCDDGHLNVLKWMLMQQKIDLET